MERKTLKSHQFWHVGDISMAIALELRAFTFTWRSAFTRCFLYVIVVRITTHGGVQLRVVASRCRFHCIFPVKKALHTKAYIYVVAFLRSSHGNGHP